MAKVTIVDLNDDWTGIYVDGKLKRQGHALSEIDVLVALDFDWNRLEIEDTDMGSLPENLEDL